MLWQRSAPSSADKTGTNLALNYLELLPIGAGFIAPDQNWVWVNVCLSTLLGYERDEWQHKTWQLLAHPTDNPSDSNAFAGVINGSLDHYQADKYLHHKDGSRRFVRLRMQRFIPPGTTSRQVFVSIQDLSADLQFNQHGQRLALVLEQTPAIVIITDASGHIEYVNPRFSEITGYTARGVQGKKIDTLDSRYTFRSTIQSGTANSLREDRRRKKDGSDYWVRESFAAAKTAAGTVSHYVITQEDLTPIRKLTAKLSYQTDHDRLTGLYNRPAFEQRLGQAIAEGHQNREQYALCYLNLDQFRIVNNTCGHGAGDELLRQLSTLIQGLCRQTDTIARCGGDEFAILMKKCPLAQAKQRAEAIRRTVQQHRFLWQGNHFSMTASIGLIAGVCDDHSAGDWLKWADTACDSAKDGGRNRVHVYCQNDVECIRHRDEMDWILTIDRAIQANRFLLYGQPIAAIGPNGNQTTHYEILIRYRDDSGNLQLPGRFMPAAERYQLAPKIDRWVIHATLQWLAAQPSDSLPICSINLSGQSLGQDGFLDYVIQKIERSDIPAEMLCFELTETAAISNLDAASEFISELQKLGCFFSLDDFGSGLSSFAYLKTLPVDYLKIDGMFVKNIRYDPIDLAMVKSISDIGLVMGKKTIAEWVEDQQTAAILRELEMDFIQGYWVGTPQPMDTLAPSGSEFSLPPITP